MGQERSRMSYPSYGKTFKKDIKVGDKLISLEVGRVAEQASAAVLATCGETVVMATIALGRKVNLGYFPLSVEFIEKLFAGGVIKGSRWVKRDGRPTDDAILKARVIDRTLRPLFPEGMTHEVQVVLTVLSTDKENDADMIGLIAASAGLAISEIPFDGPIAGLRVGYSKSSSEYIINPTNTQRAKLDMDLIVSGTGEAIVMVESGANEIPEEVVLTAFEMAQKEFARICADIVSIAKEIGKPKADILPKVVLNPELDQLHESLSKKYKKEIVEMVNKEGRLEKTGLDTLVEKIQTEAMEAEKDLETKSLMCDASKVSQVFHELMKLETRRMIIQDSLRPDGRKLEEIRPIWCEIDLLPRTHGSAMFKRGATQVISVTTLGSPSLGQMIEDMTGEEVRHYIHHYNMPPYASGEAGRIGYPKRREIGHGALASRALLPMLPAQDDFPYTIHVVSEVVSSNGSTSQASVCGSTMSLMAAGVPLKAPVAGIAMGLITDGKGKYAILSDIQGLEDHIGDMDFKVAGTKNGITALQMDIKIKGIPNDVMAKALTHALTGRLHILGEMLKCISEPKAELSQYAPKIKQIVIPASKIGELIGPGGKMIRSIIEDSGAQIDVEEDEATDTGRVNISSPDQAAIDKAFAIISDMMREIKVGDEFDGKVVRIESYGAFVNIVPNKDGLVHVSAMSTEYVNDASEIVKMGEVVHVRVSDFQDDGKIKLTMLTPEQEVEAAAKRGSSSGGRGGGGFGGGSRGGFSGGRRDDGGSRDGGGRAPFRPGGRR